jgi:hypothetical protein
MIKKYCDRCGKEVEEIKKTEVPGGIVSAQYGTYVAKTVELCEGCFQSVGDATIAYNAASVRSRIEFYKNMFPELYKEEVTE